MGPDDWTALLTEGIKGAAAVLVATIGVGWPVWRRLGRIKGTAEETRQVAEQAREQVKNDHGTNLRDDVDQLDGKVVQLGDEMKAVRKASDLNREWIGSLAGEVRRLTEAIERDRRPRRVWPSRRGSGYRA